MTKVFSGWARWGGRAQIDGSNLAGVYLLGRFDGEPPADVDPLGAGVIYVGITNRTLRERWEQFAASAFTRQSNHSGGVTFSKLFCDGRPCAAPSWLYVTVMFVPEAHLDHLLGMKQQMLAEFEARHERLPLCNTRST